MKRLIAAIVAVMFLALVACGPNYQAQQQYQDQQQQTQAQADDQYYAQQAYAQWQVQNSTRDFTYFLLYVWAIDSMRTSYYTNTFHVYNYAPAQKIYVYKYTPTYTNKVVTVPKFGSSANTRMTTGQTFKGSNTFSSSSKASPTVTGPKFGSSIKTPLTTKSFGGGMRSFSSPRVGGFGHR